MTFVYFFFCADSVCLDFFLTSRSLEGRDCFSVRGGTLCFLCTHRIKQSGTSAVSCLSSSLPPSIHSPSVYVHVI